MATFKSSGSMTMSEVRTFLRTKGATVPDYNVSLASLFATVASQGITTPGGNTYAPHAMSEFYGMNYSTAPPGTPVITLLGESEINLEPGDALPPHIDGIGPDDITIGFSEEASSSLADYSPGYPAYLDGQVFSVAWPGVSYGMFHATFLALHPSRFTEGPVPSEVTPQWPFYTGSIPIAGWYDAENDEFNISDYQYSPFLFGIGFYPRGPGANTVGENAHNTYFSSGPAVLGYEIGFFGSKSFIWASNAGFPSQTSELIDFNMKAVYTSAEVFFDPQNSGGSVNRYSGDYTVDGLDKPIGHTAELMYDLTWQRIAGTDFSGNNIPKIKINPGVYAPNLMNFSPTPVDYTSYGWTLSNGYLEPRPISADWPQPYFAGGAGTIWTPSN